MTGDRVMVEILMRQHHEMLRASETLAVLIEMGDVSDDDAYRHARSIARVGIYIDGRLDEIEGRNQPRYIAALENSLRHESKNMQRGRFIR